MQKKFLFTAAIENGTTKSSGKVFLFAMDEYVFESVPEDRIYLSIKKSDGKWLQIHGSPTTAVYVDRLAEQIEVFLDGRVTF
jgi:hypothetical protein